MSADCCTPRKRLASAALAYTPAALLALLVPKCPLCLGALLAVAGISHALPSYSYWLIVLISLAIGTLALARARRSVDRSRFSARARAPS